MDARWTKLQQIICPPIGPSYPVSRRKELLIKAGYMCPKCERLLAAGARCPKPH